MAGQCDGNVEEADGAAGAGPAPPPAELDIETNRWRHIHNAYIP